MRKTLALAIVACSFTLVSPCIVEFDSPLWESAGTADAAVLGTLLCSAERLGDRFVLDYPIPPDPEAEERASRWKETRVSEARTVRVLETWIGTLPDALVPVIGPADLCGPPREEPWETQPAVIFLRREGEAWSFWADPHLVAPDSPKSARAMRRAVARAVELRERNAPEWKVLDWLAGLIATPATRSRGLRDVSSSWWLFPELEFPVEMVGRFSAAQRQTIAAAFLAEPAPGATLPAMLEIVGDSPDPRVLAAALDAVEQSLLASDGPWDDSHPMAFWFPEVVEWFGEAFDLPWASAWAGQLWDPDSGFLSEDVRRVWPEARGRIEEAMARGRAVEDPEATGTSEVEGYW